MTDDAPVMYSIPHDLLATIAETLAICAEDLKAHVDAEYPEDLRAKYPSYQRRWKNDREIIITAERCLVALQEIGVPFGWSCEDGQP